MEKGLVNNHIHTTYSFSPYTPREAVIRAKNAGLLTAGIMDHDSIAGAREFLAAGIEFNLPVTAGLETRVSLKGTPFFDRRVNNPDQNGLAYVAMHGVPHGEIERVNDYFAPFRAERNKRNRQMSGKIAEILAPFGIDFDFERDVLPESMAHAGGTVSERTLCYAAARKIIGRFGKGEAVFDFVRGELGLAVPDKIAGFLSDKDNIHYEYDLLGVLKGGLVSSFYVDADKECMPVEEFIRLAKSTGAISAYAYLGDIAESVTGDKAAQTFEDGYLTELFDWLKKTGFNAVTYMPSRNTPAQLARIRGLCAEYGFFEICGEDINSSRQSFVCPALNKPEFWHLTKATFALIGHERAATADITDAMFSEKTIERLPALSDRIEYYAGLVLDNPADID